MFYSIEFVSALIMFAGLVVVYNVREIIESDNKTSYRYITSGLLIMITCSTVSAIGQQAMFESIAMQNLVLLIQLFYWIGMISGMTLLLSGVSNWLPIYRKNLVHNRQAYLKIELFKKIEQLIRFEHRNNVILFQSVEMILKHYNYSEVGCFVYSQKTKEMSLLGAVNNEEENRLCSPSIKFNHRNIEASIIAGNIKLSYATATPENSPDLLLPMVADGKLLGAFCFYSDEVITNETITNLKLILDVLATQIIKTSQSLQAQSVSRELGWHKNLNKKFDITKTVSENILTLKKILQSEMSVDYIAVAFSSMNKFPKISLSENNQVLQNLTNEFRSQKDLEKYVSTMNIPVVINNLDVETDFDVDITALKNNMKSILAYPINDTRGDRGVLLIASSNYDAYSDENIQICKQVHNSLASSITNSVNQCQNKNDESRRNNFKRLLKQATTQTSQASLYQMTTDFLVRELKPTFVRISLFDTDQRFLNSQALSADDYYKQITPKDATMMLMLMPHHQKVLQSRKTNFVDVNVAHHNNLSNEQRQLFGDELSQYFVVPVFHDSLIKGVISIGYKDSEVEVLNRDIKFVEDAAMMLELKFKVEHRLNLLKNKYQKVKMIQRENIVRSQKNEMIEDSSRINNIFEKEFVG